MNQQLTTADKEIDNIANEAQHDAGFQSMLKFKKGDYYCDQEQVPLGTMYLAHCKAWTKSWIHFVDKKVVERRIYRIANGERAPERDEIPDNDQSVWPADPNGKPMDPWVLQYLLPLEQQESGEVHIFVAQSFGGRRAVGEICTTWAKRAKRTPGCGQPIIMLAKEMMPTKNWGDVPRPCFEVMGWDDRMQATKEVEVEKMKPEFDDEIPF